MRRPLIDGYDSVLFDLDGTVYAGSRALEHAVEAINDLTTACRYVTNNASRAPEVVADKLCGFGIAATPREVLTSAQAGVTLLSAELSPGEKVLVVGAQNLRDLVVSAGFELVDSADDHPAAVIHGHSPQTGWAQLSEAALAIRAGAHYVATNVDTTLPQERGLMIGNGSMVAAVRSATGVHPRAAGKPEPLMFELAAAEFSSPLVVGDRLDTDIRGARAAGMDVLQVLTGVDGARAILRAPETDRATFIGPDLRALSWSPEDLTPGTTAHGLDVRRDATGQNLEIHGVTDAHLADGEWKILVSAARLAWDSGVSSAVLFDDLGRKLGPWPMA